MTSNICKHQLSNLISISSKKYDEKYYEQKYLRDYYDIILSGKGISEYSNIYERVDEIKRCTGIKSVEMARPIVEKLSMNTKLKIRVKEFHHYKALCNNLALDSFKTGVNIFQSDPNLRVVILDVPRKFKTSKYGLNKIRRIHNHKNQPTKKLIANCIRISDFIQLLLNGIYIESKKYVVLPNIVNYKNLIKEFRLPVMAHSLKRNIDDNKLRKHFNLVSQDDQTIRKEEAITVMRAMGQNPSQRDCAKALTEAKLNSKNNLTFAEFKLFAELAWDDDESIEDMLSDAFKRFDKNRSGTIDAKEFKEIMLNYGEPLSQKECDDLMQLADMNHDGRISYSEFVRLFTQVLDD
ncbi:unnamed protein product [Brachionus calyciflorus]|uniref:EF-hand domain-containing protein n=1 Tax=Brachionus calyciflorus TaxID=104777 RepID=A0A813M2A2_9BILA|nr:unnamed protein product [Brachionus calyciflorus]